MNLVEPLEQTLVRCLGHQSLHLILIPSEACDVRCESCPGDLEASRMRPAVVRGVKNLLTDRVEDLDSLTLSWSGGEPLLALDVMEEVLQHACALKLGFPGFDFQSDVTTNAHLLTPATFLRLRGLGVDRFQVPVEGPLVPQALMGSATKLRPARPASPDSADTWSRLLGLRAVAGEFVVEVRALVAAQSEVAALVEGFRLLFSADPRFRLIVRRPLASGPGPSCGSGGGPSLTQSRASVLTPPRAASGRTSQVFPDAYVVRADGRIGARTWPRRTHPAGQELGRLGEEGRLHLDREDRLAGDEAGRYGQRGAPRDPGGAAS